MSWFSDWWRNLTRPRVPPEPKPEPKPPVLIGDVPRDLLALVNDARERVGVPRLVLLSEMIVDCHAFAEKLRSSGSLKHRQPLPAGVRGEILGFRYASTSGVFRGWRDSRPHNEIMMDPDFRACGFGRSGDYWVGTFR